MKQIVQSAKTGKLSVRDVPVPTAGAGEPFVQTRASIDFSWNRTDGGSIRAEIFATKAKDEPGVSYRKSSPRYEPTAWKATVNTVLSRLDEPLPLGYSAAGVVVEVGAGLEGIYRTGDRVALAGAGVANHAELNAVPKNLTAPIPHDVSDEDACYGTLAAIALHAVLLDAKLGETVAVLGLGLVGQLAAQFLALSGVRVAALDYDQGPSRI